MSFNLNKTANLTFYNMGTFKQVAHLCVLVILILITSYLQSKTISLITQIGSVCILI